MASVCDSVENVLSVPSVSPSRRDYSLRSCSAKASDSDTSRPQSPWRPRDSQLPNREVSTFHLCESNHPALGRSTFYSGPLPVLSNGVDQTGNKLSYSSPTPPSFFSGPLTGFSSLNVNTFLRGARSNQLQVSDDASSGAPEVGSSCGSISADDVEKEFAPAGANDSEHELDENERHRVCGIRAPPSSSIGSRMKTHFPNRNCVSHELGVGFEGASQNHFVERAYKSGELEALRSCPAGEYFFSSGVPDGEPSEVAKVVTARHSGLLRDSLNKDSKPRCEMAAVAIPFKWEDAPGKSKNALMKTHSRASSNSTQSHFDVENFKDSHSNAPQELSLENNIREHGALEKGSGDLLSDRRSGALHTSSTAHAVPAGSSNVGSSIPSVKATTQKVIRSSVPFNWEEEPGKPKIEGKVLVDPSPTLQLPPRLISAAVKRNNCRKSTISNRSRSMSIISGNRVQPGKRIGSEPQSRELSVGKYSQRSQEGAPSPQSSEPSPQNRNYSHALGANSLSGPLDNAARPRYSSSRGSLASKSGPITQSGTPQCQNTESLSGASFRSPTSTLCGPGSAPSSCSRERTRTSLSAPCSHSSSGTSVELFEHWSYEDQPSPPSTSRNPSKDFESQGSSRWASSRSHELVKTLDVGDVSDRDLKMSKPSIHSSHSASSSSSRTVIVNEYSSHEEELWNSQSSPSTPLSKLEEFSRAAKEDVIDLEPLTRLPYKMPSPPRTPDPLVNSEPHSPTRAVSEYSACLPRFFSKTGEPGSKTTPCFWVENPSFHAPTNYKEDGYKSPAFKATLELLSPSAESSKKSPSRQSKIAKLGLSSSRRWHTYAGALGNSLKSMLQKCK